MFDPFQAISNANSDLPVFLLPPLFTHAILIIHNHFHTSALS